MSKADRRAGILFFMPAVVFMSVFLIYPILRLCIDSFYKYNVANSGVKHFVMFGNYAQLFATDKFYVSIRNTIEYVVIAVGVQFILGMIMALLFSTNFKGNKWIRTITLSPLMIAPLVAGVIWKFMLNNEFGILNWLLHEIGIIKNTSGILWLSDPKFSLISCAMTDIWLATPFMMLVLLAGIQGIPESILESAKIDGSKSINTFFKIMLPYMKPVIIIALVIRIIDAARSFDIIWALTKGGPMDSSEVLSTYIYKSLIQYNQVGFASAMSFIFILILLLFTVMFLKRIWDPTNKYN